MPTITAKDGLGNTFTTGYVDSTGQKTMANSLPVTIAIDQAAIEITGKSSVGAAPLLNPVSISGIDDAGLKRHLRTDTAGFLNLSTTAIAPLMSLDSKMPSKGLTTAANSQPVVLASDSAPIQTTDKGLTQWVCSFANTDAGGLNTSDVTQVYKSAGVSVNQSSGNLNVLGGTNANEEFLAVSNTAFSGSLLLRYKLIASQRIANTNFWIGLADKIGDGLSFSNPSATTVVVTIPGNPFTSLNVGQSVNIAGINGPAGCVPGRYAIASVSGNDVTFTVAGWPGVGGTGTCTLFGWNYVRSLYTGTTATNAAVDAQRRGWATGDTTATINTTASPGHQMLIHNDGRDVYFNDSLVASTTLPSVTTRASRYENIPDSSTQLYLYFWCFNGSTNPASSTTWTLGFASVETYPNSPVYLAGNRQNGVAAPVPVIPGGTNNTLDISLARLGSTTLVTGGLSGTLGVGGATATAAGGIAISPVQIGGIDPSVLTRKALFDVAGQQTIIGATEIVQNFSLGTGAAAVTDGTNGKTVFVNPVESDLYIDISAISTSPTMQVEGSFDNANFFIIPLTRIDTTAASLSYASVAAFTPAVGNRYKGKTYGAPIIRIHLTAGTTSNTVGLVRVVPRPALQEQTISPFAFTTGTGNVEAVGSANGQVYTGSQRTLTIQARGSAKAILQIESMGTATVILEGSVDGTTFSTLNMQPVGGGATVASATAAGLWEADVSGFQQVRARCSAFTSGNIYGYLKIVPNSTGRIATGTTNSNFTSTTSATVLAANGNRKAFTVYNEGAGTLYLLFGAGTASTTSYNDQVPPGAFRLYSDLTQQITGIFGSAGTARIGELT